MLNILCKSWYIINCYTDITEIESHTKNLNKQYLYNITFFDVGVCAILVFEPSLQCKRHLNVVFHVFAVSPLSKQYSRVIAKTGQ